MSVCKGCGAAIEWIRTPTGKSMPVDSTPVFIVENPFEGRDNFVLDTGTVVRGRRATQEEADTIRDLTVAFVPHWKTCPHATDFRRRK